MSLSAVEAATTSAKPREDLAAIRCDAGSAIACLLRTFGGSVAQPGWPRRSTEHPHAATAAAVAACGCGGHGPGYFAGRRRTADTGRAAGRAQARREAEGDWMPHLRVEDTGAVFDLRADVTTVGRGSGVDISLDDPSVSLLHAELGLSRNGTRVNGRPIGRRVLTDGDVIAFGVARTRLGGLTSPQAGDQTVELRRVSAPDLTRREVEVLTALCRPALRQDAFVAPVGTGQSAPRPRD